MHLDPAPLRLVDAQGVVRFGVFDAPLRCINLDASRLTWAGMPLPGPLVRFRLKEWEHVLFVLPELLIGVAVVDAKFLKTTWCHVVDRRDQSHFEHHRKGPALDVRIGRELWDDHSHARAKGYRVEVHDCLAKGGHDLEIDVQPAGRLPAFSARLHCPHDLTAIQPLVVCLPAGDNQGMYSHKVVLPVEGSLRVGERSVRAERGMAWAIWDVHKALYPHHTWWRWATGVGRLPDGREVAFNLGDNVNRDPEHFNENAVWIDGRLQRLGPARFELDPARILEPWRVGTVDGSVDLLFTPSGERTERLELGLVGTSFHQPWGTFRGTVPGPHGPLPVQSLCGVCEDHQVRW